MQRLIGRMSRRLTLAFTGTALLAICVAITSGGSPSAQAQGASAVSIIDFAFQPASVTVPVGATVTWTNNGMAPHTSTSSAGGWNSGTLNSGQSFSFTFSRAGSFSYICTIHPQMMGTVVVQAAAGAAPAAAPAAAQPTPRPAAAAPVAQKPAAAPAAAAPQAQRAAAAPAAPRTAATAPGQGGGAQAANLPRSGAGGTLTEDSQQLLPALAIGAALFVGLTTLAYRRRRVS